MQNQRTKLRQNIEIIKIALSGESLSAEKAKEFSGWGGIKAVLYNPYNDQDWQDASQSYKEMRDVVLEFHEVLKQNLSERQYKDTISSIKNATLTSFYTPGVLVRTFYEVLKDYLYVDKFYDPSAGTGLFLLESAGIMNVNSATLYEKDIVTGMILKAVMKNRPIPVEVHVKGFEESSEEENGKYSLITSNIPFNDIKIYDPKFADSNLVGKIHNYFFAKGIDKIREGGILAFLVSNSFLDTVSNKTARKYVFDRCNFISLVVMPDNLYWESAGTMAPSHFLVVQKNESKTGLSPEEELLVESSFVNSPKGKYSANNYLETVGRGPNNTICTSIKEGKNQYGKAALEIKWDKPIEEIGPRFREILHRDFAARYRKPVQLSTESLPDCSGFFDDVGPELTDEEEQILEQKDLARQYEDEEIGENHENINNDQEENDSEDIASTCCGCGVGMFGTDPFCYKCKEEGRKLPEVEDYPNPSTGKADEPTIELSQVLPEYVPFKNGIIVEI